MSSGNEPTFDFIAAAYTQAQRLVRHWLRRAARSLQWFLLDLVVSACQGA